MVQMHASAPDSRPGKQLGQNVERSVRVSTGLREHPRAPIPAGHRLHPLARYALRAQDSWTPEAHGAFWTAALVVWPAGGGRRSVVEDLSVAAALLAKDGLKREEIAQTLGVTPDSIRPRAGGPERNRPSVEQGKAILDLEKEHEESQATRLRRMTGRLWVPEEAHPQVYLDGDDPPETGFFNPLVELLPGAVVTSEAGETYLALAQQKRRQLWYARRD